MATAAKEKALRIQALVDDTDQPAAGSDGETTKLLSYRQAEAEASWIADEDGPVEMTLVAKLPLDAQMLDGFITIRATQAANASSSDYQLFYDDGAGGAPVALSSEYDGTATAVTLNVRNALVLTAAHLATVIPAGSRIYCNSTENGTRPAAQVGCQINYKYV